MRLPCLSLPVLAVGTGAQRRYKYGQTYLVARVPGEGLHGVGSHAQRTWFLPGSGQMLTCTVRLGSPHVGSDGTVIITKRESADGFYLVAIDTTTCQTLWELPTKVLLRQVGSGLIEIDRDSQTLMSLAAPK
jgi:hypothetical protein